MSHRHIRFAALVAAVLFAAGTTSRANYTVSSSISGFTFNGVSETLNTLGVNSSISVGGSMVTLTNGGYSYTDASSGATVYLGNDSQSLGTGVSVTQEQVFVDEPTVLTTPATFDFVVNVMINGSAAFTETLGTDFLGGLGYTISGTGIVGGGTVTSNPVTFQTTGYTITDFGGTANSGTANSTLNNPAVSASISAAAAAVPEPASIAMLGLGLISAAGFGLRRRMAK